MSGGKASIRIGMQNAVAESSGSREGRDAPIAPVRVDCDELKRSATTNNATAKDAQLSRVTRNSMVLVVSQHNLPKPGTDFGRAMVLPALKLSLNGFKLRDHPLLRRDPPDVYSDQSGVQVVRSPD